MSHRGTVRHAIRCRPVEDVQDGPDVHMDADRYAHDWWPWPRLFRQDGAGAPSPIGPLRWSEIRSQGGRPNLLASQSRTRTNDRCWCLSHYQVVDSEPHRNCVEGGRRSCALLPRHASFLGAGVGVPCRQSGERPHRPQMIRCWCHHDCHHHGYRRSNATWKGVPIRLWALLAGPGRPRHSTPDAPRRRDDQAGGNQQGTTKSPPSELEGDFIIRNPGGDLLSQGASPQVPSARAGLTAVFGMGTGVSPPPWPPETVRSTTSAAH
jgi:hypothetical protein